MWGLLFRGARRRRAAGSARRLFLEGLEGRRLLATLTVTGTADNDTILASVAGGLLTINVNGAAFSVPSSAFDRINVFGGAGHDSIRIDASVPQFTELHGQEGNDRISAGSGPSLMFGEAGDDSLTGGSAGDVLFGGLGSDSLAGGRGDDYLIGGSGDDKLLGEAGHDWLFGDGTNTLPANAVDPVQYALDYMDVGLGNDAMEGGDGNDYLFGGNGNDRVGGGAGSDFIVGGVGSDGLGGGGGDDVILGDTLSTNPPGDPEIARALEKVSGDAATILTSNRRLSPVPIPLPTYDDTIVGGEGDDTLLGQLGADSMNGNTGDDLMLGGDGDDLLEGGDGADLLFGASGSDKLVGGAGLDLLDGGDGADKIDAHDGQIDLIVSDPLDGVDADPFDIFV